MPDLQALLIDRLKTLDGVEARPSPVAGGVALFHQGREFAHFHHAHELDLKLGRANIQALGLSHPADSAFHPGRAAGSAYLECRFHTVAEVEQVLRLVRIAVGQA